MKDDMTIFPIPDPGRVYGCCTGDKRLILIYRCMEAVVMTLISAMMKVVKAHHNAERRGEVFSF